MAVEKAKDRYGLNCYDFVCGCGFESRGWTLKADATARGAQHQVEHETGEAMPELADFERKD